MAPQPQKVAEAAALANEQIAAMNTPAPQPEEAPQLEMVQPVETTPEVAPEVTGDEDWEHKYKTLQGMYKQEKATATAAQEDAMRTQQVLAAVNAPRPAEETFENPALVTQEEIDEYGEELIDIVRRTAQEAVAPQLHRLEQSTQHAEEVFTDMSQNAATTARAGVYTQLNSALPNWKEINQEQGFIDWLAQVDPYSGFARKQMLMAAFEASDASRVLAFFKGYVGEQSRLAPQAAPQARHPSASLESLVAPGVPHGASVAQPTTKRIWTQQEIAAFYKDVQLGKWKARQADKVAIEQDLIAAANENRIR